MEVFQKSAEARSGVRRVCIIGAGKCGIAAARALKLQQIEFDWFEMSDRVGGLWSIDNPNGRSPAYRSLRINSSRHKSSFHGFPMPDDWPTFPDHSKIAEYLNNAIDRFNLRDCISLGEEVRNVRQEPGGTWLVETSQRTDIYQAVIVANGHHWSPNWPTDIDRSKFSGLQFHSIAYRSEREPCCVRGKRVLIVGLGNTAADIACEVALQGKAERVLLSARHGAWIIPKHVRGAPLGRVQAKLPLPWWIHSLGARLICAIWSVRGERYGLPATKRWPLAEYPTISDALPAALKDKKVLGRKALTDFESGNVAVFSDGTRDEVDIVFWCTGFRVVMPFLSDHDFTQGGEFKLWRQIAIPERPGIFFLGLADPVGSILEMAQSQAELVAEWIAGFYEPPPLEEMRRQIDSDRRKIRARFGERGWQRLALDINSYVRDLTLERARGQRLKQD